MAAALRRRARSTQQADPRGRAVSRRLLDRHRHAHPRRLGSQAVGQPLVVENKAGADGAIAAEAATKAAPDGYTLFYADQQPPSRALPAVHKNPPYDPLADFTPIIARRAVTASSSSVHPSVPANNIGRAARLHPRQSRQAELRQRQHHAASLVHCAARAAGKARRGAHPYKGDGPLSVDLLGGRVHFAIATPGTAAPQVKEGKLRVLATLLPSRNPLLPEAPTFAEAGLRPLSITPWGGVFGPAHMPKEIVSRVGRELGRAAQASRSARSVPEARASSRAARRPKSSPPSSKSRARSSAASWRRSGSSPSKRACES